MNYPIGLFKAYRNGAIGRVEFCKRLSLMQGYNGHVDGEANIDGLFLTYRGRRGKVCGGLIAWQENGKEYTARSIKEFKIKIDILMIKAASLGCVLEREDLPA